MVVERNGELQNDPWAYPIPLSESTLPPFIAAILAETLLYGIHVVLFFICCFILLKRQTRMAFVMLAGAVVMFILATADVGVSFHLMLRETNIFVQGNSKTLLTNAYPKFLLHVTNNLIADTLLITRCYVVWERRRCVLWIAGIPLVIGTAFGYISMGTKSTGLKMYIPVQILIVLVLNNALTLLTAGRIWWISRQVRSSLEKERQRDYNVAAAIIIESGAIYSASTILILAVCKNPRVLVIAACIAIRTVCIMPILITVQVGVGRSAKELETILTDVEVQHSEQTDILDTVIGTIGLQTNGPVVRCSIDAERGEDKSSEVLSDPRRAAERVPPVK